MAQLSARFLGADLWTDDDFLVLGATSVDFMSCQCTGRMEPLRLGSTSYSYALLRLVNDDMNQFNKVPLPAGFHQVPIDQQQNSCVLFCRHICSPARSIPELCLRKLLRPLLHVYPGHLL